MKGAILLAESNKVPSIHFAKFEFERSIGICDTLMYHPSQFTSIGVNRAVEKDEVNKN
jgi:hypothetical protein